ncbi:hypothetical protein J2X48_004664 [Bosea sp. BE271]|jgi:hypothetical protein|nr:MULTISPECIES: hypothetical protein [Bosea]MDR6831058.1 hypothetical protein [Bosea robiniae]MDR6897751.1 hypothetical protein [Bosea sp. BE109]MDR7141148.1 hypothetical protein [Bosea sp. BE168]MDR7177715.1 hypothetical protein [Bosea sp. BE271]
MATADAPAETIAERAANPRLAACVPAAMVRRAMTMPAAMDL